MAMHLVFKEMIEVTRAAGNLPIYKQSLEGIRKGPMLMKPLGGETPPISRVENHVIQSQNRQMILRLYYPKEKEKLPILFYFHPGFFVKGDIDAHDIVCRKLALSSGCILASLNYALAPEYRFPKAIEEGHIALNWMISHVEKLNGDGRLAIGGENAGANIAATLTHQMRDLKRAQFDFQVLIYPQTDLSLSFPSVEQFASGYLLEKEALEWYISSYLPPDLNRKDPRVSPLFQPSFDHLPEALIVTAEFDPLKDEGEAYAHKLQAACIPTTLKCYSGMLHGFFQMGGVIEEGEQAIDQVGEALRDVFSL